MHPEKARTRKIPQDQWTTFLAEFTRRNRGAHARLETMGTDAGSRVEAEDRPFGGAAADIKDGEQVVWITFGATPEDHFTHGVRKATALGCCRRKRPPAKSSPWNPAKAPAPCSP